MAFELADEDPVYEDLASKFWEHFLYIAYAMNHRGSDTSNGMWDETDGFFYDVLHTPEQGDQAMRVRSMVGLIPLFAVETLEDDLLNKMPGFKRRMDWFIANRPELTSNIASMRKRGQGERRLLSIVGAEKLRRILKIMLDENEFFSDYGIRALSRSHRDHPFTLKMDGVERSVDYEPGESTSGMFGGNSNWRGPIWFPVNFLLIESLQKFAFYLGDTYKVECPVGSGEMKTLDQVAEEISHRLARIFLRGMDGRRPVNGANELFQNDPHWKDLIPFYEYFHGDIGRGVGASHQTGWTGLVAKLIQQSGDAQKPERRSRSRVTTKSAIAKSTGD
jgi:hypothetical protein